MPDFSNRLRKLRKERNLSQKKLAENLNFSRSTISNYEKNKRLPDIDILCQLAKFFDVSTDYLIGRTEIKNTFYQQVRHDSSVISFIVDPEDASFMDCNQAAVEFFAYPRKELLKMKVYETTLSSESKVREDIKKALQEKHRVFVAQHRTANEEIRDVQVTINSFRAANRTLLYCIVNDLTSYLRANKDLTDTVLKLVEKFSELCLRRFCYKREHQKGVAELAVAIGKKMELSEEQLTVLNISALLHDAGELFVPCEIMNKGDKLTAIEYELIKQHPEQGYELFKAIDYLKPVAEIILQHHERLDGSGYPAGLKGNQIKREARILAVADVLEAMTSDRPYRSAFNRKTALEHLIKYKGKKYDSTVVEAVIDLLKINQLN